MMVKVWEAFILSKNLKFFIAPGRIQATIFEGTTMMLLPVHSAILLNTDNTIYLTKKNESISIIDEINSVNHSAATGFNGVLDSLEFAINQVIQWNNIQAIKITPHVFIFPFQVNAGHWNLGVLRVTFAHDKILSPSLIIYEPLHSHSNLSDNKIKQFETLLNKYSTSLTKLNFQTIHTDQQRDGSSCGVISCENGKDFIEGDDKRLAIKYPSGAKELRGKHIADLNNPEFNKAQEDKIYVPRIKSSAPSVSRDVLIALFDSMVTLHTKIKGDFRNALIQFRQNYDKACSGQTSIDPYRLIKEFFKKNLIDLKAKSEKVSPHLEQLFSILFRNDQFEWQEGAIDFLANNGSIMVRKLTEKQASNPFSTGGGGENYEGKVRAYFALLLLTGDYIPILNWNNSEKIHLQARDKGYQTDDLVVLCKHGVSTRSLLIQVKHAIDCVPSNEAFSDSVIQFWQDYNNPNTFNSEADAFILIFEKDDGKKIDDYQKQLIEIRHTAALEEFKNKHKQKGVTTQSDAKKAKKTQTTIDIIQLFKAIIEKIENNIPDAAIYEFVKKIYFLQLDFSVESDRQASIYSRIKDATALTDDKDIKGLWADLIKICAEFSEVAGTISKATLPLELVRRFQRNTHTGFDQLDGWGSTQFPYVNEITESFDTYVQTARTKLQENRLLALHGMHGVGKTHMGLFIAQQCKTFFKDVSCCLFFNARTAEDLTKQYRMLGIEAGLAIESFNANTNTAATKVTEWLSRQKGGFLFFDNVPNRRTLIPYLPRLPAHRFLITTTSKSFSPTSLEIKLLTEKQAIELIEYELKGMDIDLNVEDIKELIELLGCLTLALVQACAYIRYTGCSISTYIKFYKERKKEALSDNTLQIEYAGHEAIYLTWDLSFKRILQENHYASELLIQLAYMDIAFIGKDFILDFFKNDKSPVGSALDLLVNYCLLTRTTKGFVMHVVLRDVIIEKEKEKEQYENKLNKIVAQMNLYFDYTYNADIKTLQKLSAAAPHVELLLNALNLGQCSRYSYLFLRYARYQLDACNSPLLSQEMLSQLEQTDIDRELVREMAFLKARIKLRQNKSSEAYDLITAYCDDLDKLNCHELCLWANVLMRYQPKMIYPRIDDDELTSEIPSQRAKIDNFKIIEQALSKALHKTAENSQDQAMVYHYYGNYYLMFLRNFPNAFENYFKAFEIKEKFFPSNEREIARTRHQMALCHEKFKEYDQAIIEFQKAYDIRKKYMFHEETLGSLRRIIALLNKATQLTSDVEKKSILSDSQKKKILMSMFDDLNNMVDSIVNARSKLDQAYYYLALICLLLARKDEAKSYLEKIKKVTKPVKELMTIANTSDIADYYSQLNKNLEEAEEIEDDDNNLSDKEADDVEDEVSMMPEMIQPTL